MSKIHLEIEIPGNAKTYEFVLDDRMKIGTAKAVSYTHLKLPTIA